MTCSAFLTSGVPVQWSCFGETGRLGRVSEGQIGGEVVEEQRVSVSRKAV